MIGAFRVDGSWDEHGPEIMQKGTHRFVQYLVGLRRKARLSPEQAAKEIVDNKAERAFPLHNMWAKCPHWPMVDCSTAAEETVKRAGLGIVGERHWCAGSWIEGEEKNCSSMGHRRIRPQETEGATGQPPDGCDRTETPPETPSLLSELARHGWEA